MSIPTPPLPGQTRGIIYGLWAWASVLLAMASAGIIALGDPGASSLKVIVAVNAALYVLGAACGFLAKNNVDPTT